MKKKITFVKKRSKNGQFTWSAVHSNGNTIADGAETYFRKGALTTSLKNFIKAILEGDFEIKEFEEPK
jgi:uncharacterized protein YegP (UPF0339 family)